MDEQKVIDGQAVAEYLQRRMDAIGERLGEGLANCTSPAVGMLLIALNEAILLRDNEMTSDLANEFTVTPHWEVPSAVGNITVDIGVAVYNTENESGTTYAIAIVKDGDYKFMRTLLRRGVASVVIYSESEVADSPEECVSDFFDVVFYDQVRIHSARKGGQTA